MIDLGIIELSPRQEQVLVLMARGYPNKKIAVALDISVRTVEHHRLEVYRRIGVHDLTSAVRFALNNGYVKVDELGLYKRLIRKRHETNKSKNKISNKSGGV